MTLEECFDKAKNIINIANAFNNGYFEKYFDYREDLNEHTKKTEKANVIIYNEDPNDVSGYDENSNYVCNNPNYLKIRTGSDFDDSFFMEDLPTEFTDEVVFQYSTIYPVHVLDAMLIMWYIKNNYNNQFYFDLDYYEQCMSLL